MLYQHNQNQPSHTHTSYLAHSTQAQPMIETLVQTEGMISIKIIITSIIIEIGLPVETGEGATTTKTIMN